MLAIVRIIKNKVAGLAISCGEKKGSMLRIVINSKMNGKRPRGNGLTVDNLHKRKICPRDN